METGFFPINSPLNSTQGVRKFKKNKGIVPFQRLKYQAYLMIFDH
jgi:hypothetical protein